MMTTRILEEDSFHRSIINECHQGQNYAIIQQEKERGEWVITNHIMLPKTLISSIVNLQLNQLPKKLASESEGSQKEDERVVDEKALSADVRKIFFNYDSDCIPLYENQEGLWREIEHLESFWGIDSIKSPSNHQASQPAPTTVTQTAAEDATPIIDHRELPSYSQDIFVLDTPPVNNCLAPKKRRLDSSPRLERQQSKQKDMAQRILFEDTF